MLPRKLKNMNLFNDGVSLVGQVTEVGIPKLVRKMEEFRAGGMNAPIDIDLGMEKLEMPWKCGGVMEQVIKQFGITAHSGVLLRFAGAYQREDGGGIDAVQVVVRGRHKEIDQGTAKSGDNTEFNVTSSLSYFKYTLNGVDLVEIDILNMIEKINGVDRLAEQRRAIL